MKSYVNTSNISSGAALIISSAGRRFANVVIDSACTFLFTIFIVFLLVLLGVDNYLDTINDWVFAIIIYLLYYVPQEVIIGKTIAKCITGTKVVTIHGLRPSLPRIAIRTVFRFIPLDWFSFFGENGRPLGFHDVFSGTRAIDTRVKK
jgi:uncharacterized RDD family membrane protein YckC